MKELGYFLHNVAPSSEMDKGSAVTPSATDVKVYHNADRDLALLHGRSGETGQTVLRHPSQPTVAVLSGTATSSWDATTGDLRLGYTHSGLTELHITGGGRRPLTLLLADDATADTFWRLDTATGPVLVRGPELVRTATVSGPALVRLRFPRFGRPVRSG
ncbi:MAG TPA: hypothetical protein VGD84_10925 [Pseudonocardiaceae bacterium]